ALTYVRNTGAAFGVLAAAPPGIRLPLFFVVTIAAAGALFSLVRRTPADQRGLVGALGAVLGGALGNLVCRLRYGEVIDFLGLRQPHQHALGDLAERPALRVRGLGGHDRQSAVARLADGAHERHLAEERDAGLARHGGAAAVAEELGALAAAGADVEAHVL